MEFRPPYWVGFDLGGTKMLSVLYDAHFQPVARRRRKTKGHEGVQVGIQRIVDTIQQTLAEAEIEPSELAGVGIGCPGIVDMEAGTLYAAANLGWRNVPLKEALESQLPCPVAVLNDVDAGVYAENRFGAAQNARCVVGVFPGTGVGGGCVLEGQIVRGRRHSCMEIGHVTVDPLGHPCGCGRRGCLETEASRLAIASQAAMAAYRGEAPHLRKLAGTDIDNIRSGILAEAIQMGDVAIERIVRHAARAIGVAIANVVHLLAPDVVVLGGGLVEAMPNLFVEEAGTAARHNVSEIFAHSFEIVAAKLGDDANVMGAAGWASHTIANASRLSLRA